MSCKLHLQKISDTQSKENPGLFSKKKILKMLQINVFLSMFNHKLFLTYLNKVCLLQLKLIVVIQ